MFRYTLTQVYLCPSTDTTTPPPTRKAATPTGTIKSGFTVQGVMGTSRQLGGAGGLRVRAVPVVCSSHSAPGSGRLHFLTHPPLSPTPVTPSFFHCCLKSDHTLLQQLSLKVHPSPQSIPYWQGLKAFWVGLLVYRGVSSWPVLGCRVWL